VTSTEHTRAQHAAGALDGRYCISPCCISAELVRRAVRDAVDRVVTGEITDLADFLTLFGQMANWLDLMELEKEHPEYRAQRPKNLKSPITTGGPVRRANLIPHDTR
jgi:hypothetical protein